MSRIRNVVGGIMVALISWSCVSDQTAVVGPDDSRSDDRSTSVGTRYLYIGYDHLGKQIVKGLLTIVRGDSNSLSGTWQLEATGDPSGIGPQVGSGRLIGAFGADRIWLGLNPDYADNNVMLMGRSLGPVIVGTWEYVGFPGVLARGTFRAIRVADLAFTNE